MKITITETDDEISFTSIRPFSLAQMIVSLRVFIDKERRCVTFDSNLGPALGLEELAILTKWIAKAEETLYRLRLMDNHADRY